MDPIALHAADEHKATLAALAAVRRALDAGDVPEARRVVVALERRLEHEDGAAAGAAS